jgi:hypothetical protein
MNPNSDGCLETAVEDAIIVQKQCSNPGGIFRVENPENGLQLPTAARLCTSNEQRLDGESLAENEADDKLDIQSAALCWNAHVCVSMTEQKGVGWTQEDEVTELQHMRSLAERKIIIQAPTGDVCDTRKLLDVRCDGIIRKYAQNTR